jgi:hypothetical protein
MTAAADLERLGELMADLLANTWQKQTAEPGGSSAASEIVAGGAGRVSSDQQSQPG